MSLLAFLIITINNKIMVKAENKLVPTPKVEPKIEPKVEELKEEKKLAEEKEAKAKIEAEEKKEAKKKADEKAKEDKKDKEDTKIYSVFNKQNQFVREYTPEIHGDKRKALAEEFAKKIKGKVVIK